MNKRHWWLPIVGLLVPLVGCVQVETPREINIGSSPGAGSRGDRRPPKTSSHAEAREELHKAYDYISRLEDENRRLERKADRYERERDDCRDRLERYED